MDSNLELMGADEWKQIESTGLFRRHEFVTDPYKLSRTLVFKILAMRVDANSPCNIHEAFATTGHAPNGQHPKGRACDLGFPKLDTLTQVRLALKHGFTGIGAYPGWKDHGIHVDVRPAPATYWIEPAAKKGTGEYVYFPTVDDFLTAVGQIA